jgi:hypothetical protein
MKAQESQKSKKVSQYLLDKKANQLMVLEKERLVNLMRVTVKNRKNKFSDYYMNLINSLKKEDFYFLAYCRFSEEMNCRISDFDFDISIINFELFEKINNSVKNLLRTYI